MDIASLFMNVSDADKDKVIQILDDATTQMISERNCEDHQIEAQLEDLGKFSDAIGRPSRFFEDV